MNFSFNFRNFLSNFNETKQAKIDKVFYINLDDRNDRRREIEEELQKYNIPFERFPAIKEELGALGCSKSHLEVLKIAKSRGYSNVLILEDDFQFVVSPDVFYNNINNLLSKNIDFDVCLLSYNIKSPKWVQNTQYDFLFSVKRALTTSGYLVRSHYYDTLISSFHKSVDLLEVTGNAIDYSCDMTWQYYQYKDNWVCFKNKIGIQRVSYSDIEKRIVDYKV
jgi:glycosyl transferase family 25